MTCPNNHTHYGRCLPWRCHCTCGNDTAPNDQPTHATPPDNHPR